MRKALIALVMLGLAAAATACTSAQAKAPATRPALEVPPPPPRIIEPLVSEAAAPIEPVADLPPPPTASASRPRPPRDTAPKEAAKADAKPDAAPPAEAVAPATPPPNPAPPQIRTPADNSETARHVRDILDRANKMLASIDYRPLNRQRRESYDTAKRFILEAEDAIKASNFVYARFLADKADILAKELQGR